MQKAALGRLFFWRSFFPAGPMTRRRQKRTDYCLGASFFLAASVAALAASSADEALGEGDVAAGSLLLVEGAGVAAGGVAGAGSVTGAGGGVTTAGAASSFFPQAVSAATAINEASRTEDDFFMETPLQWDVRTKKF
ncbi:hypothetical protein M2165_003690 [Variovorax sp. TBS-050B]|nr:hypothetical protein [Variovorax sp. TBS-050B]